MEMSFGMGLVMIPVVLFIFLLPIALLVVLQVWLCKKSVKLGLILPGISLALSLMLTFSIVALSTVNVAAGGGNLRVTDEYGNVVQEEVIPAPEGQQIEFPVNTLIAAGVVFLVTNVPTVIFGGIWLHFKGRKDTLDDLKRMQIEDLE